MSITIEPQALDVLEQLETEIRRTVGPERAGLYSALAGAFYRHVAPADLAAQLPGALLAVLESFVRFSDGRRPGESRTRVYEPTLKVHGWTGPYTVVDVATDDMPFLVDSVAAELLSLGVEIQLILHPNFRVRRDEHGRLCGLEPLSGNPDLPSESMMHIRVEHQHPERAHEIARGIERVLEDVRVAVADHPRMSERCLQLVASLRGRRGDLAEEATEIAAFLEWLNDGNFIYLGYRRLPESSADQAPASAGPGLGLLRDATRSYFDGGDPPPGDGQIRIFKANARSTVHRRVHVDAILLANGEGGTGSSGGHMFLGLFSLSVYSRSPSYIPLLRRKLQRVFARAGFSREGHDGKSLWYILETYPRDELFQISEDTLLRISLGVLQLKHRPRVALFVRRDPLRRFVSCLVYVPRDRFDTDLRQRIQRRLAAAHRGTTSAFYTHVGDDPLARVHVIVKTPHSDGQVVNYTALERRIAEEARSWQDRLEVALDHEYGEEESPHAFRRYQHAFPGGYVEVNDSTIAAVDTRFVDAALETRRLQMQLYAPRAQKAGMLGFKLYSCAEEVPLSHVLPMLENMGLRVVREVPYTLRVAGGAVSEPHTVWLHDFLLQVATEEPIDVEYVREDFETLFAEVWHDRMENDGFNGLMLHAGVHAHEVRILRSYCAYLQQCQVPFSQEYMQRALRHNAGVTRLLVDLFNLRFNPDLFPDDAEGRASAVQSTLDGLSGALDAVVSLDEDRILRSVLNVIRATLRTNFFRGVEDTTRPCLSFKLDSGAVDSLVRPRPWREIFVASPSVEGIHLRFGAVARGGLRWSDRREDYRTEVLGLAKAQQVKNAVIVPAGSKGGFVLKRPPPASAGRQAIQEEGIRGYRAFISGLLDLTDNQDGEAIVSPPRTVTYDEPDPYLVVAADKGTATFSDIANAVSKDYEFWLDDAFASGGAAGYDHKAMGITARGAWESVKRHFRERGKDVQTEEFTCIGVGDMSGDVFGNGMLLSRKTRLLAAFNHRHVFVDPNPDAEASWHERKRLFDLPGSSWGDYDRAQLSPGGLVVDRSAKAVDLTPAVRELLGCGSERLTPAELIRCILTLEVELLFFGGIGTYVRASGERDADVGDRANDALRVEAKELRAAVVGEGANLGMTQRGRVEFALAGGACNADFIDNSAGVDCSDHEVNLKILLGAAEVVGHITRPERDQLLHQMTDDVAALVLRDNVLQALSLSVTLGLGAHMTNRLARYMRWLERVHHLDRRIEFLPDEHELAQRAKRGVGFARPELCVLMSHCKNQLSAELLATAAPDDPYLERALTSYFPERVRDRFAEHIRRHRLRREIITTVVVNDMVNRVGMTFAFEMVERSGHPADRVALAYVAARELLGMGRTWEDIEALDATADANVQAGMYVECARLLASTTFRLLQSEGHVRTVDSALEFYGDGVRRVLDSCFSLLGPGDRAIIDERTAPLVAAGVGEDLARRIGAMPHLLAVCDLVGASTRMSVSVTELGRLYFAVGQRFGFEGLRNAARQLPTRTSWEKEAAIAVTEELFDTQLQLAEAILECERCDGAPEGAINRWLDGRGPALARHTRLAGEVRSSAARDLSMLTVATQSLKALLAG